VGCSSFEGKVLTMPLYTAAFICCALLGFPLAVIQVLMRRQVHDAKYGVGSPETGPWNVRFINELFGKNGIWNAHKQAYKRSVTRLAFIVFSAASLISALVALVAFLVRTQ
jgi:hypothetical protein